MERHLYSHPVDMWLPQQLMVLLLSKPCMILVEDISGSCHWTSDWATMQREILLLNFRHPKIMPPSLQAG